MNKAQLIDAIAEKAGLTKADSKKALEAFVETVGETLNAFLKEVKEPAGIRKPEKR